MGGYVLGHTWQPGADTIDPKHTPVGTCEINRKFNNDRRVSPPGTTSRYVSTQTYPVFAHRTGSYYNDDDNDDDEDDNKARRGGRRNRSFSAMIVMITTKMTIKDDDDESSVKSYSEESLQSPTP